MLQFFHKQFPDKIKEKKTKEKMIANKFAVTVIVTIALTSIVSAQRSPYAGARPAGGYKDRLQTTPTTGTEVIGNRLGDVTTQRLPYDALGDAFIVHHSNQLPIDQRPFWLLNQAHIEAQRGTPTNAASGSLAARPALTAANATALGNNTSANQNNNTNISDRFAINNNLNSLQDNTNYDPNIITQQQIVYPENISNDQRQQMQRYYDQQRLQAIAQRQQQQQQQITQNRGQNQQTLQQNQQNLQQNQQNLQQNQQNFQQNQPNFQQNQQTLQQNQQQISQITQGAQGAQGTQGVTQQQIPQASNSQLPFAQRSNFVAPNFEQHYPHVPIFPPMPRPPFPPQYQPNSFQQPQRLHPDSLVVAPYFVDYDS